MRRHAKASFAAPIQANDRRKIRIGFACLTMLGLVAFTGVGAPSASAVDTCPNAVFRTGASSKLPDCRAYELVTPAYTAGLPPNYEGFIGDLPGMFTTDTVTPAGDSVVYHTVGGGLSGFSATGYVDRYQARRTAQGWVTEPMSPGGDEMEGGGPGGVSPDHEYSTSQANNPTAKLWPAFAGELYIRILRTPNGYEPLARGSLGESTEGWSDWISAEPGHPTHVIFSTNYEGSENEPPLEPEAPNGPVETIYDRTPGGPTHVVSLLPGEVTPADNSDFLGTTKDGTEIAFEVGGTRKAEGVYPFYVRRNNAVTEEVVRPDGLVPGKELKCIGEPGSATLAYQWLRDGNEIGGATSSTYTTTAADEGSVVQCQITATGDEGVSLAASATRLVEPYQGKDFPKTSGRADVNAGVGAATVGTLLTCSGGDSTGFTSEHQWLRDGNEIGGATSSAYTAVEADVGHALQCRVRTSNANGTALAYSYNPVSIYKASPTATTSPSISNLTSPGDLTPAVGDELTCSNGTWSASPSFAYAWLRSGTAIGGATSSTYTTTATDEEKAVQCLVTAKNGGGSTTAASERVVVDPQPASAPPKQTFPSGVFGTAKVGRTLFCGAGGWEGGPSFSYQWLRNGDPIGGATSSAYTLTAEDLETVVQCLVLATNAGGRAVGINANEGAKVVTRAAPAATATLPAPGLTFDGIFNGRVFYSDAHSNISIETISSFGDLYMYDLDAEKTTRITTTGDASIVNVSEDGSHVYFISKSPIDGEGEAGKPNLGVWTAGGGAKFIATVAEQDVTSFGLGPKAALNTWAKAISPFTFWFSGRAIDHTRSSPDGSAFVFESTAQLSGFDNMEASPEDCGETTSGGKPIAGQPCDEVYRYDAQSEELTCVSCGPGAGPATGEARLQTLIETAGGLSELGPATPYAPVESLTSDGETVFFESTEGLLPQDGNEVKDVYRWKQGLGLALISNGQGQGESAIYGVTPSGSDVVFATRQTLLPEDENGTTSKFYDARVDGGFPPPEETVTEVCVGDPCQGAAGSAPETPNVASSSLNGAGNVPAKLKCPKRSRLVVRKGSERCLAHKEHHKRHRRSHHKRGAAR